MQQEQNASANNWLHRLRCLSLNTSRRKRDTVNVDNKYYDSQRNSLPVISEDETKSCSNTRKSFRKSLKKMHIRVKNYMFKQSAAETHIPEVPLYPDSVNGNPSLYVTEEAVSHLNSVHCDSSSSRTPSVGAPSDEINRLINAYWYWGPLSRIEAEEKLECTLDGTFLVRDSASSNYLFSISFRTLGKTFHARIDHKFGRYSLYEQVGFCSVYELIENALKMSEHGVYCYSTGRDDKPNYPLRFLKPLSRYTNVPTLRHLCRFVIRQCTNINDLSQLPLPASLNTYLQEGSYF